MDIDSVAKIKCFDAKIKH